MSEAQTLEVEVAAIEQVTPLIKHFRLAPVGTEGLPAFSGGSHIVVVMRTATRVYRNPYSLLSPPHRLDCYEIGVRRMEESRGGSHFMHDRVAVGTRLEIAHPVNLFALDKIARKHVLIAGGIGITPFMAHLEDLYLGRVPYELHYSVRGPDHAAFLARIMERTGGRAHLYYDSERQSIDFDRLLSSQALGTHVYVCGPKGMIDRVAAAARDWGWPDSHIHWEQFSAPPVGDAFEVFLARSKMTVHVPPDQSLLESIEAQGVEVPYLCRGGVCGFCQTRVLEVDGELLHNDHFLSDADKAKRNTIMPCVSRARCKSLVLDL
ncbi:MAG TPA: PDR/VanB family oxidoreductase [Steroidobacteraceae bacterium]|jgi:ferredoxin-NADP reductase|nr:PDR/VanB family oxidoreductase [Steroidobacteraceae bacterium]